MVSRRLRIASSSSPVMLRIRSVASSSLVKRVRLWTLRPGREQPLDHEVVQVAGDPVPVGEDQQLLAEPVDAGEFQGEGHMGAEDGAHLDVRAGEVERVRVPDQQQEPVMRALGA